MLAMLYYQLNEYKRAIIVFYLVLTGVLLISSGSLIVSVNNSGAMMQFGGIEFATVIFLFVGGLNSFKENFYMGIQNGITRKNIFISHLLEMLVIAGIMALIDQVIMLLGNWLAQSIDALIFAGILDVTYPGYALAHGGFLVTVTNLAFKFAIYLLAMSLGYLITQSYYKMNKFLKIMVSAGIPILLFLVLPILDTVLYDQGIITRTMASRLAEGFTIFMGINTGNPWLGCVFVLLVAAILSGLSWLLIRNAVVKR